MAERAVRDILDDWRAAERALEDADDGEERETLEARVSELHEEHAAAIAAKNVEAESLRGRDEEATQVPA